MPKFLRLLLDLIIRLFCLLFWKEKLVELGHKHEPNTPIKHLKRNIFLVRKNVHRAFCIAVFVAIILSLIGLFAFIHNFSIPHEVRIIFRLAAYFLVLWALLSPTYLGIKSTAGEYAEIVNEEWHRSIYSIGLILLLLSYLIELIEPADIAKINLSAFIAVFEYLKSQPFSKYIIGYGISVVGGHIFINPINEWMRNERNRAQPDLAASFNFGQLFGRDFQGGKMTNLEVSHGQEEVDGAREIKHRFGRTAK